LDAERILERDAELYDLIPSGDIERLQGLLDTWCMGLTLDAFEPDYERAVLFDTEPR
jgi:hypothetical protein